MAGAYSADLRERVLLVCARGRLSRAKVATLFQVAESTVYRWLQAWRTEGRREAKPHAGGPAPRLDQAALNELRAIVAEANDLSLAEYAQRLHERAGVTANGPTVCRARQKLGLVRSTDVLVLVGGSAGLLVELYRRGFAQVCLAVAPSPCMAHTADVLWLPHAGEPSAGGRLPGFLILLRDGGTLVLHGRAPASHRRLGALRRLLRAEGFAAVEQSVDAGRICLVARGLGRSRAQAPHQSPVELATPSRSSWASPGQRAGGVDGP